MRSSCGSRHASHATSGAVRSRKSRRIFSTQGTLRHLPSAHDSILHRRILLPRSPVSGIRAVVSPSAHATIVTNVPAFMHALPIRLTVRIHWARLKCCLHVAYVPCRTSSQCHTRSVFVHLLRMSIRPGPLSLAAFSIHSRTRLLDATNCCATDTYNYIDARGRQA